MEWFIIVIHRNQIAALLAIALAIGAAFWFGFTAGMDKAMANDSARKSMAQCERIRAHTAVLRASRFLYFIRLAESEKIALEGQDIKALRQGAVLGMAAANEADSWCKNKLLSASIKLNNPHDYAYPNTVWDAAPNITPKLGAKIANELSRSIPEVFGEDEIDKFFWQEDWRR